MRICDQRLSREMRCLVRKSRKLHIRDYLAALANSTRRGEPDVCHKKPDWLAEDAEPSDP